MPPIEMISFIHPRAIAGRQVGSFPLDLLKREPTSQGQWSRPCFVYD